ncbi:VWA containing CoxE family protein [Oscillospiraceae bacterium WX1]
MFTSFFYLLRAKGLKVSTQEWFALLRGLQLGLHRSSLTGFYYLARATLVKTEADFDAFDLAFIEYFEGIKSYDDLPEDLLNWLSISGDGDFDADAFADLPQLDLEALRQKLEGRTEEEHESHDGDSMFLGTGGASPFGNSGDKPGGIRIGGVSKRQSALQVAGARRYLDFREDNVLEDRQFQMAFRSLRQFSANEDGPKDELKLEETISETSENAGRLKLVFGRPRRNSVKLLVLFDSGGSMLSYAKLCGSLFQAANKSNHFKDLKTYYFHNCFYDRLYTTPACTEAHSVETEWVLQNLKSDYRVIVVGDAAMAPTELLRPGGAIDNRHPNQEPGIEWIRRFRKKFDKMIWLNPVEQATLDEERGSMTMRRIKEEVPMYHLSVGGLQAGLKSLIAAR